MSKSNTTNGINKLNKHKNTNDAKSLTEKTQMNSNNVIKKIIMRVKDEFAKDEIKNEINKIVNPLLDDVYSKICFHYMALLIILTIIIILLITIIIISIINLRQSK